MFFSVVQAQDKSQYYFKNFPNSPSTATFLRYGDLQNSEYTGTNSPQIPLFTFQSGAVKIPLILNYISGNGIKVAQEAGSVGLGWDLSLPTITQSILGGYSDFDTVAKYLPEFSKSSNPLNAYFPHSDQPLTTGFVSQPTIGAYSYFKTIDGFLPLGGRFQDLSQKLQVDMDTSPDVFTCNLFGEKLEFIVNNYPQSNIVSTFYPTFYCLNKKGYRITYDNTSLFKITDPSGTNYYFERVEDVKTLNTISKNYVVTKIVDVNNNTINFSYNEYLNIQNLPSISEKLNYTFASNTYHYNSLPLANTQSFSWIGEFDDQFPGSQGNPLYSSQNIGFTTLLNNFSTKQNYLLINNITGDFGKINFYYSNRVDFPTQKLDKIEELNFTNQIVNKIDFSYDYFNSQSSANVTSAPFYQGQLGSFYQSLPQDRLVKRLKLLSVVINNVMPYVFNYNETLLPSKHSTAMDYWGYANGGLTNKTLFLNPNDFNYPTPIPLDNNYNNNFKQANLNFAQSALLKKIIYPTKGSSSFEYELNTANNLFYQYDYSKLTTGNGLRLISQTNRDANNKFINKTELKYYDGISTNPVFLFNKNNYSTINIVTTNGSGGYGDSQSRGLISMSCNNNNSASPLSSGDYIVYSKVVRVEKDSLNNAKGSIETNYVNNPDFHYYFQDTFIPISMPSAKSNATENGKVLSEVVYDTSMNKIKQTDNTYEEIYSTVFYGTSLSKNSRSVWNTNGGAGGTWNVFQHGVTVLGYYPIFSKYSQVKQSIIKEYVNNKILTTQSDYLYSMGNLKNKVTTFPDGGTEAITQWYSYDDNDPNSQRLQNANILSSPLSKVISKGGQDYSQFTTKYEDTTHLNPTSVVETSQVQPPNYAFDSRTIANYISYDAKGNLLLYTNNAGTPTAIVWGYNQTLPIMKIEGKDAAYLLNTFDTDLTVLRNASNSDIDQATEDQFRAKLDLFQKRQFTLDVSITTYTYNPLVGVTSITPPSGVRELYIYDTANRLIEIRRQEKDINGNVVYKTVKELKYNYKN